jgi:hypothetical protein
MPLQDLTALNPDGTRLGQTSADLVGFRGATPIARASISSSTITTLSNGASGTQIATAVNDALTRIEALRSNLATQGLIGQS